MYLWHILRVRRAMRFSFSFITQKNNPYSSIALHDHDFPPVLLNGHLSPPEHAVDLAAVPNAELQVAL